MNNTTSNRNRNKDDQSRKLNIRKWILIVKRIWPWSLLCLTCAITLSYLYISYNSPVYTAVSSLMIKDEKKGAELMTNSALKQIGLGGDNKLLENEIEILKSFDLMDAVVREMQLFVSTEVQRKFANQALFGSEIPFSLIVLNPDSIQFPRNWKITTSKGTHQLEYAEDKERLSLQSGQEVQIGPIKFIYFRKSLELQDIDAEYRVKIIPVSEATFKFSEKLAVQQASKVATVINLGLSDANESRAVEALESYVKIYNRRGLEDKNRMSDTTVRFLENRLLAVQATLQGTESSVEQYKSRNRITDLSTDAQVYLSSSNDIDLKKAASQTQLNIISALEDDLKSSTDPKLVPSTLGIDEPTMGALIKKHNELILQQERLTQTLGPKNPLLVDIQQQVKEVRSSLLSNVQTLKRSFAISYGDLQSKDAQLSQRIRSVPQLEKKLVDITRDHNVQSQLYSFLLERKEEAEIARVSNIEDSRIIAKSRSIGKVAPKPKLIYALGFLIGLLLPFFLITVKGYFNDKVDSKEEIENKTDLPILGTISHVKGRKRAITNVMKSRTIVAEQLRNIRTALSFTKKGVKTILVTSHQPGDGKTFVSLNIAASFALLNKKTIILEFDMRRPKLQERLSTSNETGLSNYLIGANQLDEVIVEIPENNGNLFWISAGHLPPNPAELILSPLATDLFQKLRERFDYIVIDSPPYQVVTDAALLQEYSDITLFILREGHTHKSVFDSLNHLQGSRPDVPTFLVINGVGRNLKNEDAYGYKYGKDYYVNKPEETAIF